MLPTSEGPIILVKELDAKEGTVGKQYMSRSDRYLKRASLVKFWSLSLGEYLVPLQLFRNVFLGTTLKIPSYYSIWRDSEISLSFFSF